MAKPIRQPPPLHMLMQQAPRKPRRAVPHRPKFQGTPTHQVRRPWQAKATIPARPRATDRGLFMTSLNTMLMPPYHLRNLCTRPNRARRLDTMSMPTCHRRNLHTRNRSFRAQRLDTMLMHPCHPPNLCIRPFQARRPDTMPTHRSHPPNLDTARVPLQPHPRRQSPNTVHKLAATAVILRKWAPVQKQPSTAHLRATTGAPPVPNPDTKWLSTPRMAAVLRRVPKTSRVKLKNGNESESSEEGESGSGAELRRAGGRGHGHGHGNGTHPGRGHAYGHGNHSGNFTHGQGNGRGHGFGHNNFSGFPPEPRGHGKGLEKHGSEGSQAASEGGKSNPGKGHGKGKGNPGKSQGKGGGEDSGKDTGESVAASGQGESANEQKSGDKSTKSKGKKGKE